MKGRCEMKITIEIDDSDMALLFSYFCHRNGYIPTELMFKIASGTDHQAIHKLERLFEKLADAVGWDTLDSWDKTANAIQKERGEIDDTSTDPV